MKTTTRILTGWIALAAILTASTAMANLTSSSLATAISVASTAQVDDRPKQAEDLLRRARQAIADNDLTAADKLISQAEALGIHYSPFYIGDTPKTLRRSLERKRDQAPSATLPNQLFSLGRNNATQTDPFATRNATAPGTTTTPLPRAGNTETATPSQDTARALAELGRHSTPMPPAATGIPAPSVPGTQADPLLQARQALARGDVERAKLFVGQARQTPNRYGLFDDTPDQVETAIQAYQEIASRADTTENGRRQHAKMLMDQAEALLRAGDANLAEQLALDAARLRATYSPHEQQPTDLIKKIVDSRRGVSPASVTSPVVPANAQHVMPATGHMAGYQTASHALYDTSNDPTRTVQAQFGEAQATAPSRQIDFAETPAQPPVPTEAPIQTPSGTLAEPMPTVPSTNTFNSPSPGGDNGMALFQQGQAALQAGDTTGAYDLFKQAYAHVNELDPTTAQRLQTYLQSLSVPPPTSGAATSSMVDRATGTQQLLIGQVATDLANTASNASRLQTTDPKAALALLEDARLKVENAGLEPVARQQMLARVDRYISDTQAFIEHNRARIELDERNAMTRDEIDRAQQVKLQTQQELATMVDQFKRLVDEERFEEAHVVALRAAELAPDEPVASLLAHNSRFLMRKNNNDSVRSAKEAAVWDTLNEVDIASIPFPDGDSYIIPDDWADLTRSRLELMRGMGRQRTEREIEIEQKLTTPVSLRYTNAPLEQVIAELGNLAQISIVLDPQGLGEEGVMPSQAVSIQVENEIMLKSALNLILEPLRLGYVIKDEVLKVTSESARKGEVYTLTYNVADLVIPIPNFVPNDRMGLAGAYANAMATVGFPGGNFGAMGMPPAIHMASADSGTLTAATLAQQLGAPGNPSRGPSVPMNNPGPGGLGGGNQADFDSLIDLITATIEPDSWDDVGGTGSIQPYDINLSLVVSQTQEVHEEIADLLEQLRRMQDLQVTIEVRFITLNDNFFERVGVDFDFDIDDNIDRPFQVWGRRDPDDPGDPASGTEPSRNTLDVDGDRSVTVGMQAPGVFSADLDIPFTQDSFALAVPQFGGFDAAAGASLGFAILSDIEAFFFINAAQGDRRSNVMQAPKVTLFNGQQASINDTSQSPFVMSVVPVVGDFAAAQQPVIVVLNEGTSMTVQAVVSADRRFVRLTVVPYFSKIDDVQTFRFVGSETTTEDVSASGDPDNPSSTDSASRSGTTTREGTTVQLPTQSSVNVSTTVSVPDGGTVLLGGIKRLSEGRNEFGTPILNKIPYVSRLFKNVGIGRETQSLMMVVTPRIIIQEEEEERVVGVLPTSP